ncbi:MAG: HU family DNA-binding protein [Phycisphaerae bacterium]|nr:HU family DNA-binding protein [Phycisphaerae bacterium]
MKPGTKNQAGRSLLGYAMKTVTKKDLVDRISAKTGHKRNIVKQVLQEFLESIVEELGNGNRLEFRDFGVFEIRQRAARQAQNPKTMQKVAVPRKRAVKFKVGRLMKEMLTADRPAATAEVMATVETPVASGTYSMAASSNHVAPGTLNAS